MGLECGECERDIRGGHATVCSRNLETVERVAEALRVAYYQFGAGDWESMARAALKAMPD